MENLSFYTKTSKYGQMVKVDYNQSQVTHSFVHVGCLIVGYYGEKKAFILKSFFLSLYFIEILQFFHTYLLLVLETVGIDIDYFQNPNFDCTGLRLVSVVADFDFGFVATAAVAGWMVVVVVDFDFVDFLNLHLINKNRRMLNILISNRQFFFFLLIVSPCGGRVCVYDVVDP